MNYHTIIDIIEANPILAGIIGSLSAVGISKIGTFIFSKISNFFFLRNCEFTLNGFWISEFNSATHKNKRNFELVKINQKKENISLRIQHYSNEYGEKIVTFKSKGVLRTNEFYSYYMDVNKNRGGGGVFLLKLKIDEYRNPYLDGFFIEWLKQKQIESFFKGNYKLNKVKIPFINKLKFFLGMPSFYDFYSIRTFVKGYSPMFGKNSGSIIEQKEDDQTV